MTLRVSASIPGRDTLFAGLESDFAEIATSAMRGATKTLQTSLRDQVRAAGMGNRLANTWRSTTYPDAGNALNPTGYAWSNAPLIIDAFSRGATIRPLGGKNFLWIPTRNVPRQRGRGGRKAMTPTEVEIHFNQDLFVRRKANGRALAFVSVVRSRSGRGYRQATSRRLGAGRSTKLVLMFVLTPLVQLPRKFDLQDAANHAAADFVTRFEQGAR